jgi:hypothetical protein
MANTLRFKRGLVATIPTALAGEPLFTTDTFDLYIGNGTTNTRFQKYIASGTTSEYLRGDGSLATFPSLTGFVPYTGATANVDLGTHTILAQNATISSNGSGNTATITHSSGSGIGLNITKGGNGEGLYINKTSGSGNAATIIGTLNATTLVKSGGTSTQYLMADGTTSTLTNPITGTGAAGQVAYFTGATTQAGSNNLFFDSATIRLGIGTAAPSTDLHISRAGSKTIRLTNTTNATEVELGISTALGTVGTNSANAFAIVTNNTERMRLTPSTGNVHIGTFVSDSGQRLQVTGTGYVSSNFSVGSATNAFETVSIRKTMTGLSSVFGVVNAGQIQSDATSNAYYYATIASTQATTFNLNNLSHYQAQQGTLGAGSTVVNQYGFEVNSTLIGATNNFGFYGNIAAGTGRWNLYMNGTANNYINGDLLIGSATDLGNYKLQVTGAGYFSTDINFPNTGEHYIQNIASTTFIGLNFDTPYMRFAVNNTVRMQIASNGNVLIGSATDGGERLQVTGTMRVTGASTIGGNLTVDTNTLFVDATDNEVGIGTTNPLYTFHTISANSTIGAFRNSGAALGQLLVGNTAGDMIIRILASGDSLISSDTSKYLAFGSNGGTERMRLDASGNLGLGVTPSAWNTILPLQIRNASFAAFTDASGPYAYMGANWFFSSGDKYISSFAASLYAQNAGRHIWFNAPSGTAGNAITFTQAMTLDASGNLLVGSATSSGERLQVTGTAKITGATSIVNDTNAAAGLSILNQNTGTSAISRLNLGSANSNWFFDAVRIGGNLSIKNNISGSPVELLSITNGGNLAVDTNTLFVDATNNRVGVGTATPSVPLDVVGAANFSSTIAVGGTATFLNPSSVNIVGTATLVGATARNTSSASGNTQCGFYLENGTSNGQLYKAGTGYTTLKTIAANDLGFYNAAAGNISILNDFASGSIILTAGGSSTAQWTIGANGDLTAADGENIIVGSTNGTKIGTAATQKIGFWNATPIVQPNNSVAAANFVAGIGSPVTTLDAFDGYTIGQVVKALRNAGILS